MRRFLILQIVGLATVLSTSALGDEPGSQKFERIVIDADFPGGYQVEVADVNGDKKPDIVALGGSTLAWYENPTWKKRIVSTAKQTPDIISSATADLDGDGKAEIAIAYDFSMNEPKRGKLSLAVQGATVEDPWTFKPIHRRHYFDGKDEGGFGGGGFAEGTGSGGTSGFSNHQQEPTSREVPSIHRLRWRSVVGTPGAESGAVSSRKKLQLVVAPIFGKSARPPAFDQEPARLQLFDTGDNPKSGYWFTQTFIGDFPVLHAIEIVSLDGNAPSMILGASNRGVTATYLVTTANKGFQTDVLVKTVPQTDVLVPGAPGDAPKKGASEVHLGRLKDGRKFLSTIEPWHGTDVVIYSSESLKPPKFGARNVIDSTLKEGHALWVADVDGDGDDEVFAGYRGGDGGVLMFDFDGKAWNKTILDPGVTAQDLRGGDIDGDGKPDIVAIGGQSHNVVWYRPIP